MESSILYSEMLTDYERIGDHMLNIAQAYDAIEWSGTGDRQRRQSRKQCNRNIEFASTT